MNFKMKIVFPTINNWIVRRSDSVWCARPSRIVEDELVITNSHPRPRQCSIYIFDLTGVECLLRIFEWIFLFYIHLQLPIECNNNKNLRIYWNYRIKLSYNLERWHSSTQSKSIRMNFYQENAQTVEDWHRNYQNILFLFYKGKQQYGKLWIQSLFNSNTTNSEIFESVWLIGSTPYDCRLSQAKIIINS